MNFSTSTTGKTEALKDTAALANQWDFIDWDEIESGVNRMQTRIAKATAEGRKNKARRLQYLLTHSFHAKAYAVRKVTTNKGKHTPGVDKKIWSTSASKMKATLGLTDKRYKTSPLRRVYISKKDKGTKRPLGIPTMYDRAMQTLYALALEPIAEATGDTVSFGFRKSRSAHDACEQAFLVLSRNASAHWVLEGDIKGCFDNISHTWLMDNIPMDKKVMRQFLKSGFVHNGKLFPTEVGSPQGGAISSIYANMVLDGLEKLIQDRYHRNPLGNISNHYRSKAKVNLIRYADDFIVTAATKETAEEVRILIAGFCARRGLELSEEKTIITHIERGFDFLGWTFRKFQGKLLIKPSKKSIKSVTMKLSNITLVEGKGLAQDDLIVRLNQVIKGWSCYHMHAVSKQTFKRLDYTVYKLLRRWAQRRHNKKNRRWCLQRYWHERDGRRWHFASDVKQLTMFSHTPIIRHPRLKLNMNAFLDKSYFESRKEKTSSRRRKR
jgi:RNA-directed DNA polymerase